MSLHVLRPILFYLLLMPPVLVLFLWADTRLRQRVLRWHRAGVGVKAEFWPLTAALALALGLVVVPVLNHLLFPEIYTAWSAAALVGVIAGLLALGWAGLRFARRDRALAGRCANATCDQRIEGPFRLGATCPRCSARLHEWLVAPYDDGELAPGAQRDDALWSGRAI